MGRKSGRKAINKLVKKIIEQNQKDGDAASYIGCCEFGMERYGNMKPIWTLMYVIAIFLTIIGVILGIFGIILCILFWIFTIGMLKHIRNTAGIIIYNEECMKIIRKCGKESYTLSISNLISLSKTFSKHIYTGEEQTIQIIGGGGKGFADFMDFLHEFHPEMVEKFVDDKIIYNCYMSDKNNMYI